MTNTPENLATAQSLEPVESRQPRKVYIKTHGCQMNEYDSSRMLDLLKENRGGRAGRRSGPKPDLLLLNTCSIREKAQEKVFHQLGRWRSLKQQNPDLKIAVGGCVASQEGEAIGKRAPYVDVVFGPQTLHKLPEMLNASGNGSPVVDISFPEIEKFDRLPEPEVSGCQAFLTIMEGCSKYCSFCVVPYTRGEEVSRPLDDVLAEAVHLAGQGVREINLLGQNVNAYRGLSHEGKVTDLAYLDQLHCQYRGDRSNSLYHFPSGGIHRQSDPGLRASAGTGQSPALAGAKAARIASWQP